MFSPGDRSFESDESRLEFFHISSDDDLDFDDTTKPLPESSWLEELLRAGSAIRATIASNDKRISKLLSASIASPQSATTAPQGGYSGVITKRSDALDPEPADGFLIAIQVLQLQRFSRRFAPDATGDSVYIWLASRPEVIASGLKYGAFELVSPQGNLLAITKTLTEQSIQNRSIFHLKRLSE
jgi:hypothetical protein